MYTPGPQTYRFPEQRGPHTSRLGEQVLGATRLGMCNETTSDLRGMRVHRRCPGRCPA